LEINKYNNSIYLKVHVVSKVAIGVIGPRGLAHAAVYSEHETCVNMWRTGTVMIVLSCKPKMDVKRWEIQQKHRQSPKIHVR